MQTTHRKAQLVDLNPGPSCCKATVQACQSSSKPSARQQHFSFCIIVHNELRQSAAFLLALIYILTHWTSGKTNIF